KTVAETLAGPEIRSVRSGNWNAASTWGGQVPVDGVAIIEEGHEVTVATNVNFAGDLLLHGTLGIRAGRVFTFTEEDAKFNITDTGMIRRVFSIWDAFLSNATFVIGGTSHVLTALFWQNSISGPTGYGDNYIILPIELLAFNADLNENFDTDITWITASEENNDYFTIERSLDGKN